MRTRMLSHDVDHHAGFGAGAGDFEKLEFECPCGKGRIVEEHDNIPGFRDHDVYIDCPECEANYVLDTSRGVYAWELIPRS